jgi:hypothetical protein
VNTRRTGAYPALTDDEKRTLLVLFMEDIRGSFDLAADPRTWAVIDLAAELGYEQVKRHALAYARDDEYRDGRHFRTEWTEGGYQDPPFPVVRTRSEASEALQRAVDDLCDYPEYRLETAPREKSEDVTHCRCGMTLPGAAAGEHLTCIETLPPSDARSDTGVEHDVRDA